MGTVLGADAFITKARCWLRQIAFRQSSDKDNVDIGALYNDRKGVTGDTTIGEGTKIDNQVHVGHDTIKKMFNCFPNRNCGLCYHRR
jgi:UDP-3-O-[3-hydroxymyristoyl] glucosamine N-acyltransferase